MGAPDDPGAARVGRAVDRAAPPGAIGTLTATPVKILGFYSPKHHAIFTRHDTNTPVICEIAKIVGHVDHLDLMPGATLHLPAR